MRPALLALLLTGCSCPPLADEDAILREVLGEEQFAAHFPAPVDPEQAAAADAPRAAPEFDIEPWRPAGSREGLATVGDGLAVPYTAVGEGARGLVFVHGWACDRSFWRAQLPELSDLGPLLALDLPGHGDSPAEGVPHSMALYADAVLAAMDDVGMREAVLVGHSNGLPVIREALVRAPERVLALIDVDGALRPVLDDPEQIAALIEPFRGAEHLATTQAYVQGLFAPELDEALRAELQQRMTRTAQSTMVGAFEAAWAPELQSAPRVDVPLLCLMSEVWGPDYRNLVNRLAPELTYETYPTSHFVMLDAPVAVNARIRRWLRGLGLLPVEPPSDDAAPADG